ncbi:MAG: hypothetical protein A2Y91_00830 [Chloroflexi bacterium RBG_13_54_8]|nr:MAG: hypothetical protein A2Y91_00830 [Chloroflexi bacterium RBG_13_54_8]
MPRPLGAIATAVATTTAATTIGRRTTTLFAGLSALRAALWLIGISLGGKKLLLGGAEGETCTTFGALEGFVRIAHG